MTHPRFLLLGWDAADWQVIHPLMDAGEMPYLKGLLERGVMGDLMTLRPVLSPMLWTSIATGKRADSHGIYGFTEVDAKNGRVLPSLSTSRTCKALWNITSQNGLRTNVTNWFCSHPAEPVNGVCVSEMAYSNTPKGPEAPWPLPKGTFHPPELEQRLQDWRLHPSELDADILRLFVPQLEQVDQEKDKCFSSLIKLLSELFTTHAITVDVLENHPWDFMAAYYISIDHFSHRFMKYHPPRRDHIDEREYALYHDVVRSAYRMHDVMLGKLLASAGEDCYVMLVSDHGFESGHLRPAAIPRVPAGPAEEHRDQGIFCFAGPGIRKDAIVHGASQLDVTPTVLHALGLAVGRDMEGRVLTECWESPAQPAYVDSWETIAGNDGRHDPGFDGADTFELDDASNLLQQFADLGYLEAPTKDNSANLIRTRREQDWNLARVFLEKRELDRALPLLAKVYNDVRAEHRRQQSLTEPSLNEEGPGAEQRTAPFPRPEIAYALAHCYLALDDPEEAESVLAPMLSTDRTPVRALLLGGRLDIARGEPGEALKKFLRAESELEAAKAPMVARELGQAYFSMRKYDHAENCFRRSLDWNPGDARSQVDLARTLIGQKKYDEAVEAALGAVTLNFQNAGAHLVLGQALAAIPGEEARAEQAFQNVLKMQPANWQCHRALMNLYRAMPDKEDEAKRHEQEMEIHLRQQREAKNALREQARQRAAAARAVQEEADRQAARRKIRSREFLIVSGLPRSGTSLMMSMLEAGGIEPMTDGVREADSDNLTGYYEWEAVKRLANQPELLEEAHGKAVKVVSPLLSALPRYHRYKVIFMVRPIDEVWDSQQLMKRNRKTLRSDNSPEQQKKLMERHREQALWALHQRERVDVLEVEYGQLIQQPEAEVDRIAEFLGSSLRKAAMMERIRPELYRQRAGAPDPKAARRSA
jgi:predicted AlkP superfamily phosphohydrolase/phosphomutase/tetratricopeptide (TPR) repeat protein